MVALLSTRPAVQYNLVLQKLLRHARACSSNTGSYGCSLDNSKSSTGMPCAWLSATIHVSDVTCVQGSLGARIRCKSMSSNAAPISTETGVSVVYVTVPSEGDVAKQLAGSVINNKLAACVNILPGCLRLQT